MQVDESLRVAQSKGRQGRGSCDRDGKNHEANAEEEKRLERELKKAHIESAYAQHWVMLT